MSIEKSVRAVEVVALNTDPPVVLDLETPVRDALRRMREAHAGCAFVCRDGMLSGIFTERDVLYKVIGVDDVLDRPVSELMTADPVRVHENDPIRKAVFAMHHGGFRSVPVVDAENVVVGCVRQKDIVHLLVHHFARHVLCLPPDPEIVPLSPNGG